MKDFLKEIMISRHRLGTRVAYVLTMHKRIGMMLAIRWRVVNATKYELPLCKDNQITVCQWRVGSVARGPQAQPRKGDSQVTDSVITTHECQTGLEDPEGEGNETGDDDSDQVAESRVYLDRWDWVCVSRGHASLEETWRCHCTVWAAVL
jgi:hypothetical protein